MIGKFHWICCKRTQGVCMFVCMSVLLCVCVIHTSQTNGPILIKRSWNIPTDFANDIVTGFWNFEIDYVVVAICVFALQPSRGRNIDLIVIKFELKVRKGSPVVDVKMRQDRLINSCLTTFTENSKYWHESANFRVWTSKMSMTTDFYP